MKKTRSQNPPPAPEFPRRDFLRGAGFSLAAAVSSCSRLPVDEVIPHLVPLESVPPGEPLHYATVCKGCPAGCGVLATCLDGRPIKLEGNPDHLLSGGALCAAGQASVLALYDPRRRREPSIRGQQVAWDQFDDRVREGLARASAQDRWVVLLSTTRNSPVEKAWIRRFLDPFSRSKWIVYDPAPVSVITAAHQITHGVQVLPRYQLDRADRLAGFGADFLGTWISPVEFSRRYRDARTLEGSRLRYSEHVQFEAFPTLTGARADRRFEASPDLLPQLLLALARDVAEDMGEAHGLPEPGDLGGHRAAVRSLSRRLLSAPGRSLVLCGLEDLSSQILTNYVNHLLGAYGRIMDLAFPSFQREGRESELDWLLPELQSGSVGAMLVVGANPVYDLPFGGDLPKLLARVPLAVSFSPYVDETAQAAGFHCPEPHFLEAWGDSEPNAMTAAIQQPCCRRRDSIRTLIESLAAWSGSPATDLELVRSHWQEHMFPRQVGVGDFEAFWNAALQKGVAPVRAVRRDPGRFDPGALVQVSVLPPRGGVRVALRPSVQFPDVSHAANPWLLELPDPMTRLSWGNALEMSPGLASRLQLEAGDLVRVATASGAEIEAPVLTLPGIAPDTAVLALGFGSAASAELCSRGPAHRGRETGAFAGGVRAGGLAEFTGGHLRLVSEPVEITPTGRRQRLPLQQLEDSAAPRSGWSTEPRELKLVQTMNLVELLSGRPQQPGLAKPGLWGQVPPAAQPGFPHWGMVLDLGACTGCGACVVACQAENNVPVVGPDEAGRRRLMHWLRVDRYLADSGPAAAIHFLPVPCQHCAQAPCEVVCPVAATVHGEDGLNVQVYNRCIGTRYCANNCPWKVRAFNWFDYPREPLETLQLNPLVTVRSRGVMEKCTFCIQRIQSARLAARSRGVAVADGEVQPACAQTCPSRAIVFGDLTDPQSEVSRLSGNPRSYRLLEELGTEPSVFYLKRVFNLGEEEA